MFWLLLIFSFSLFSVQNTLPQVIDFKSFQAPHQEDFRKVSPSAFTSSLEIGSFFEHLKQTYSINTIIETGSYLGQTSLFFAHVFENVHTIEISEGYYNWTQEALKNYPNTTCHFGSSEKVLQEILPSLENSPLIFYLDAHWYDYWPLLSELEAISMTHRDHCIIVVNGIKIPEREDIIHDRYGGVDCSYEYIKRSLDTIFTDYTIHYVIPADIQCGAKLVAIPKQLQKTVIEPSPVTRGKEICLVENCGANPDYLTTVLKSRNVDAKVVISHLSELSHPLSREPGICDSAFKILFWNIPGDVKEKEDLLRPLRDKMILFMWEPPCIIPEMYSEEILKCFSKIYTWDDDLVDNIRFFKFYYPVLSPPIKDFPHFSGKKLCTVITGNGKNEDPRALYSERMRAIAFFEEKEGNNFDFYGRMADPKGYDFTLFKTYRGPVSDKIRMLKNYRFSICYENTRDIRGYVTEKIFNCFQACNVPVYWGASNIEEYVPKDCFIDRRDFNSLDDLYFVLKNMGEQEYNGYIYRIRSFLSSEKAKRFSLEQFHNTFAESIRF